MIKFFLYLIIAAGLILLVGVGILWLLPNYNIHAVEGNSMSPAIKHGDCIVTKKFQGEIKPGTIVVYTLLSNSDRNLIFHRVISVNGPFLITKGDAVEGVDPWPIPISAVKEVYLFKIPYLGYVASFMKTPFYWLLLAIYLIFCFYLWHRERIRKSVKLSKGGKNGDL